MAAIPAHRLRSLTVFLAGSLMFGLCVPSAVGAVAVNTNTLAPTDTVHSCGNGIVVHTVTPHSGFDPLTATDAQLENNALPPRPADAKTLAVWKKTVTAKHAPGACPLGTGHPGSPAQTRAVLRSSVSAPATTVVDSPNWAGYQAEGSFVGASGEFTVPAGGTGNGPAGVYESSSWVGLGQGNSDAFPLVQAGSESDFISGVGFKYYTWWEVFPELSQQKVSVDVNPGDTIFVLVIDDYLTKGTSLLEVMDDTTGAGEGTSYTYTNPNGMEPDGTTEWILERTTDSGAYPMLSDATTSFFNAYAWDNITFFNQSFADMADVYPVNMWNCTTAPEVELASPGAATNGTLEGQPVSSFTDNWDDYGTQTNLSTCGGAW